MNDFVPDASVRSRDRILDLLLKSEEPVGVQAVSTALGVSRNAAHQHIMALEREGLIERSAAIRTRGRPSQGYRLSAAGKATFPRQYALLARQMLEELARHLGPEELRTTLQRIGRSLADSLRAEVGDDPDDNIRRIAALMRELGYESRAVDGDGGREIEAHNCVFHDLAMADQTICEVDLALLGSLSGRPVVHRRCMARGERSCRFAFAPPKS
ncbi:MAG TPA: helix-turn-helix domain-containing protein [Sphingomicrobium sp.]|nr:helix-turn-helix domain-containing protein [Sphingomicrobium sp.]